MSGGAFDYLCHKEPADFRYRELDVKNMAARLEELGYTKIAEDTLRVYSEVVASFEKMEEQLESIHEIWRAVEWYDSADIGIEQVKSAAERYQQATEQITAPDSLQAAPFGSG